MLTELSTPIDQESDLRWLVSRLIEHADKIALHHDDHAISYTQLVRKIGQYQEQIEKNKIPSGSVVVLCGDYNLESVAMLIALILHQHIVVPNTQHYDSVDTSVLDVVQADFIVEATVDKIIVNAITEKSIATKEKHKLIQEIQFLNSPGLILLSSGSTGLPKAMLLNMVSLLSKHKDHANKPNTMMAFLLFDHIGGINTLFHVLMNGGTLVPLKTREVGTVCHQIERYGVEILPTTPTFLNMLLVSQSYKKYDLSSLRVITYGTESMPENTLKALNKVYPKIKLKQTYGMSEIGILPTKSKANDSIWLKLGGDNFKIKVVDDILWVKAPSAMIGYLNAPSPFDEDGWLCTGDVVLQEDGYFKILGREKNLINVGGLKVIPEEVENTLLSHKEVDDVVVWGKKNPVTGQVVAVKISTRTPLAQCDRNSIKAFCEEHMDAYKVPRHIEFTNDHFASERGKKDRTSARVI